MPRPSDPSLRGVILRLQIDYAILYGLSFRSLLLRRRHTVRVTVTHRRQLFDVLCWMRNPLDLASV